MTAVTPGRDDLLALAIAHLRGTEFNSRGSIPPQPVVYIPAMPVAVRDFILTRLAAKPDEEEVRRPRSMAAQWTYDPEAEAYYFAPMQAAPPPYKTQRHVQAIIDIAADGTLAGVELIDNMPPPPTATLSTTGEPKR